jgi:hypothetical protein
VAETSEPASATHRGNKSAKPVAETTEPVSTAPETSTETVAEPSEPASAPHKGKKSGKPVAETTEPVSTAPESSAEPVAGTSEPVSPAGVLTPAEPLTNNPALSIIPELIVSAVTPKGNVLPGLFLDSAAFPDLAVAVSGDSSSAVSTDRRGRDGSPANDDPSPAPGPAPQAPAPVAPAGASGAPGGGSSGGFIALAVFFLLATLPLSRVVELSLTRMRSPRLVADLARPD